MDGWYCGLPGGRGLTRNMKNLICIGVKMFIVTAFICLWKMRSLLTFLLCILTALCIQDENFLQTRRQICYVLCIYLGCRTANVCQVNLSTALTILPSHYLFPSSSLPYCFAYAIKPAPLHTWNHHPVMGRSTLMWRVETVEESHDVDLERPPLSVCLTDTHANSILCRLPLDDRQIWMIKLPLNKNGGTWRLLPPMLLLCWHTKLPRPHEYTKQGS